MFFMEFVFEPAEGSLPALAEIWLDRGDGHGGECQGERGGVAAVHCG